MSKPADMIRQFHNDWSFFDQEPRTDWFRTARGSNLNQRNRTPLNVAILVRPHWVAETNLRRNRARTLQAVTLLEVILGNYKLSSGRSHVHKFTHEIRKHEKFQKKRRKFERFNRFYAINPKRWTSSAFEYFEGCAISPIPDEWQNKWWCGLVYFERNTNRNHAGRIWVFSFRN